MISSIFGQNHRRKHKPGGEIRHEHVQRLHSFLVRRNIRRVYKANYERDFRSGDVLQYLWMSSSLDLSPVNHHIRMSWNYDF